MADSGHPYPGAPTDDEKRIEWRDYITREIGPLLMGRNLGAKGGSFVQACHEIADVLYREPEPTKTYTVVDERDPACVEAWEDCEDFAYDPKCCRFPKSCSAGSRRMEAVES
jgi:hypothetical protein